MCKCYIEEKNFTEDIQFFETIEDARQYGVQNSKITEYKDEHDNYLIEVVYCVYIYKIEFGKSVDLKRMDYYEVIRAD